MRKLKIAIATVVLAAVPLIGAAPRAEAMVCEPELRTACAVAARVICTAVAKGEPCLA